MLYPVLKTAPIDPSDTAPETQPKRSLIVENQAAMGSTWQPIACPKDLCLVSIGAQYAVRSNGGP
jgi:hypothetical protein